MLHAKSLPRGLLILGLAGIAGCSTVSSPPSPRQHDAPAASERAGRNPTSYPIAPEGPLAPPAEGVTMVHAASWVYEPAPTYQQGRSARDLAERGVEMRVMDPPVPRQRARPMGEAAPPRVTGGVGERVAGAAAAPEPAGAPTPAAPPALATSFTSVDFGTNIAQTNFAFIPADPIAAAGPNHVVNVVNVTIAFHQKNGTLDFVDDLQSFFAAEAPDTFTFDPKVLFDPIAGRFVVVTLELEDDGPGGAPEVSEILLAVSDDADPNGTWCSTTIPANTMIGEFDHWADYPGFAVDEEAVYVTANLFRFAAGGFAFGGVRLWVVDKGLGSGGFYDCGAALVSKLDPYAAAAEFATTTQPAQIHGLAPPGVGTFLVSYSGLRDDSPGGVDELVQIVRVDDPLGSPVFTQELVNVGNLEDFASFVDAPQSGTSELLETNDRRALDAEWFDGSLWMTATISPPDAGEITAHWWELDTSTLGSTTLVQQGDIFGDDLVPGLYTFFPSVAVNGAGQAGFGYSGSASTIFPSSFYTVRDAADAPGSTQGTAVLQSGTDFYDRFFCGTSNRWGDFSGAATDPVDGCFWFYNKHAGSRAFPIDCDDDLVADEDGTWSTAYGKVCLAGACPADMFLQDVSLGGTQVRAAASRITTGTGVSVPSGADVTFRAGARIVLGSGFSVAANASFTAGIAASPCP
ncbi:MAG TPA: hypothetical protein VMV46_20805 [Thermoanaerobaculia bacterium]|nr:hypothetical protein [Thermoanaerobaculia bacterium]